MFWDKKENRSSLPDLPPAKTLSAPPIEPSEATNEVDEEEETVERHNLPAFPDSPMKKGFSQAAIKDAVTTEENEEPHEEQEEEESTVGESQMPSGKKFKAIEMDSFPTELPSLSTQENEETEEHEEVVSPQKPMPQTQTMSKPRVQKGEDIFVKIDKFYSARKALADAKAKLEEIDDLLKRIRETKMREEQELSNWEKEISTVRMKVNEVTENIFEKLD